MSQTEKLTPEQRSLVEEHYFMVAYVLSRDPWRVAWRSHSANSAQLESDAQLGLIRAAQTWDGARSPFRPWAVITIRRCLVDELRQRNGRGKIRHDPSMVYSLDKWAGDPRSHDRLLPGMPTVADHAQAVTDRVAVVRILEGVSDVNRSLLATHYLRGRTQVSIGEAEGVSESRISQRVRNALAQARKVGAR